MSNIDTFDPFDDEPIPMSSSSEADTTPISESDVEFNTQSRSEAKTNSDDEELYALIDAQPPTANTQTIEKHAQSNSGTMPSSGSPFQGISSYKQLNKTIFDSLKRLQESSSESNTPSEFKLHTVSAQPYKASKPYHVTSDTNETYLFAITLNETTKYNVATATFDGDQLVQIEILRRVFTPDTNLRYPLLSFAHDLLASIGAGGVYLLEHEPVILANGHAAPIYIRDLEFEMSYIDGRTHVRLQSF